MNDTLPKPIYDYAIHNTKTGETKYVTAHHRQQAIRKAPWPAWECQAQCFGRRFDLERTPDETQNHNLI